MWWYLAKRLLQSLATLFVVSFLAFFMSRISGSPVDALLPVDAGQEEADILIAEWGLDRPLPVQYLTFLGNALQGDLGEALKWRGQSALGLVLERLPATMTLAGAAILLGLVIAVPLGVISAVKKGTWIDRVAKVIALLGQSLPEFWLGIVLIWIIAVNLGWLPTSGTGGLSHLVLPAITLSTTLVAAITRLTRSAMLDALDSEFIKLCRVKGVRERRIIWVHALRNAVSVPLTYFGVLAGAILTRTVVIETVFAWPGTGSLVIEAVLGRDFAVVQAAMIVFVLVFIAANLFVDILYAVIDPRIRVE
ncbi:MAG: ABC transporter permease [Gemmatimonadetes bacterium]|nr:ABC transporter permease [Gemmatimonadota bacterium]MYG78140.1 ABC transporter permease [Acidimicrobiaceae bacterium]